MGESESRNDAARDFFYDVEVYRFEILALRCNRGLAAGTCLRRSEEIAGSFCRLEENPDVLKSWRLFAGSHAIILTIFSRGGPNEHSSHDSVDFGYGVLWFSDRWQRKPGI